MVCRGLDAEEGGTHEHTRSLMLSKHASVSDAGEDWGKQQETLLCREQTLHYFQQCLNPVL